MLEPLVFRYIGRLLHALAAITRLGEPCPTMTAKKKRKRAKQERPFRILSLDGGGSRGVYTLGVLKAVEEIAGKPLHRCFDLMYGTSTGSIIATLLACGGTVDEVTGEYFERIPGIMKKPTASGKSKALRTHAKQLLGKKSFADCKRGVKLGIVGLNCDRFRPIVFKSSAKLAHGQKDSFEVGLGAPLQDAVIASCSAYPYFKKAKVVIRDGVIEVIDGGYVANNPTFFALIDAVAAIGKSQQEVSVLSVGTGDFPPVPPSRFRRMGQAIASHWFEIETAETIMRANANSLGQIQSMLLPDVKCVRLNETFNDRNRQTTFLEHDANKLKMMHRLGYDSVESHKDGVSKMLSAS